MYDNRPEPRYPRSLGEIKDMKDLHHFIDGYDCGIRYMDEHIGQLFSALDEKGVLEDTAIIISGDHAENMGELGIYSEHATADNGTCRISLIVRWPGGKSGHVDNGLHYNVDLAPTYADLFGQNPKDNWDGESFAPAILEGKDCGREYLVISQCAHVCQRGVRWGPWLYIRTYHDGYHLFPDEMLFNIEDDPHEQNDLAGSLSDICRAGNACLNEWHARMMTTMPEGYSTDPMRTVLAEGGPFHARGHLQGYCDRLAATGRGYAIEELKRRHPQEFAT